MKDELFKVLAVGLGQWEEARNPYPYPPILQQGMSMLAAHMMGHFPVSFDELRKLFELPLAEWWQWDLPDEIDSRFSLWNKGRLDEQILDYLCQEEFPTAPFTTLGDITILAENDLIRSLVKKARLAYNENPEQAEADYTQARRFLIEHPYTTPDEFNDALVNSPYRDDLRAMYERAASIRQLLAYKDIDGSLGYSNCPECGIMRVHNGERISIKPSVCLARCPGTAEWEMIVPHRDLMVLKAGVQLRTMIPGVSELRFERLLKDYLREWNNAFDIFLWPGIDRFDYRLVFPGETAWAVDLKDYKSPAMLGQNIKHSKFYRLEERLRWDRAFYVIPSDREVAYPGYIDIVRSTAEIHHSGIQIIDTQSFTRLLEDTCRPSRHRVD